MMIELKANFRKDAGVCVCSTDMGVGVVEDAQLFENGLKSILAISEQVWHNYCKEHGIKIPQIQNINKKG